MSTRSRVEHDEVPRLSMPIAQHQNEVPVGSVIGYGSPRQDGSGTFAAEWRESYGPSWLVDLALLGAVIFLLGATQPLSDPDLPLHLATGEWIVRHRAVPFVEPFAWTRVGAPYYAYSWAAELSYYLIIRWCGPLGLHLLNGALLLASAAAMLLLGRAAGWRPWVAFCMAGLNVAMARMVVAALRPQLVLFALVPLAWACAYQILGARRIRWPVIGLVLVSAAAANSHLFFVLTAAPIALVVASPPRDARRGWAICLAISVGWLVSPYALVWEDVFRLNFAYNALLVHPSPIREFGPGFRPGLWMPLALGLVLLPWYAPSHTLSKRERFVHSVLWAAGLIAFGYAVRLLLCWWLIVLPAAAITIDHLGRAGTQEAPRRWIKAATYTVAVTSLTLLTTAMLPRWRGEGNAMSRRLPTEASSSIEPLLVWLECHAKPGAGGRVYTWFNYGSYLTWRLPLYSASIDGRTIFPDSVAKPEALTSGLLDRAPYGVWRSADIAIIPRRFAVAATLDTAQGWRLAAFTRGQPGSSDTVGVWVKNSWWAREGLAPLAAVAQLRSTKGNSIQDAACTREAGV